MDEGTLVLGEDDDDEDERQFGAERAERHFHDAEADGWMERQYGAEGQFHGIHLHRAADADADL